MMSRLKVIFFLMLLPLLLVGTASAQDQQTHVVLPGENLFRIAQQYGISVSAIAEVNDIANTWRIYSGQTLIIPNGETDVTNTAVDSAPSSDEEPIIVRPADSAPADAPVSAPADAPADAPAAPTAQPLEYHTVIYGQSLAQIAQQYQLTLNQIAQLNDITNPNLIYAGQRLIVSGSPATADAADTTAADSTSSGDSVASADTAPAADSAPAEAAPSITHIVQRGESLGSIATRYGVSYLTIAQANHLYNADHIEVGQELLIPGGAAEGSLEADLLSPPAAPPARIGVGKEIIVDLSDSRAYAYEDGKLVRNVLGSTGLPGSPTVQGSFTIQRKYVAQTMTGPGYYLPDVPYVMYFYAGYALHGTYWHNNFGHPMSHGCVNLPTPEAEWFYNWTEIGTPVYVQP